MPTDLSKTQRLTPFSEKSQLMEVRELYIVKGVESQKDRLSDTRSSHKTGLSIINPLVVNFQMRLQHLKKAANLRLAYFTGKDLRGAYLSNRSFKGKDLSRAYLSDADLSKADLSDANLSDADLTGADLCHAYLKGADLRHACLRGASLNGACLRAANLQGTVLTDATGLSAEDIADFRARGAIFNF